MFQLKLLDSKCIMAPVFQVFVPESPSSFTRQSFVLQNVATTGYDWIKKSKSTNTIKEKHIQNQATIKLSPS